MSSHPIHPETNSPPPQTIVIQPSGGAPRWLCWLGWTGFVLCALFAMGQAYALRDYFDTTEGITERHHSGEETATRKIAVLRVAGIIAEGDGFAKRQIDRIREDEDVEAIVVRVDSPGGTVTGSDYLFHHLTRLRKEKGVPLVVSMGSIAASGGYYVSMAVGDQEKSIYAEPSGATGSIGVIIPYYDLTGAMAEMNIENASIASHPNKQMLSMTRKLTPEQREILQQYVNETFERFKGVVKVGRPYFRKHPEKLEEVATGELFSSMRAKELGLVDETGFIEDAIARAAELAALEEDDYRVIEYDPPPTLSSMMGFANVQRNGDWTSLLNLTAPRAWYLATTLPPLIGSQPQYGGEP
ncbi:MAG: signal peptide peptidase SppA [Planctomycetes bacterium]|nr:signal peptide peptidase SppA [Planctomycetota bacterium]